MSCSVIIWSNLGGECKLVTVQVMSNIWSTFVLIFSNCIVVFLNLQIVSKAAEIVHIRRATFEIVLFEKSYFLLLSFYVGSRTEEEEKRKTKHPKHAQRADLARSLFFGNMKTLTVFDGLEKGLLVHITVSSISFGGFRKSPKTRQN